MFESIKKIISGHILPEVSDLSGSSTKENHQKQIQVATAAIFVELAKADGDFSEEERLHIVESLKGRFGLDDEYVNDLIELSKAELNETVSLYEFSGVINENFTFEDKQELLKNLWRLIYTDKKLDKYEDHLIKIIGGMLKMEHKQVINTKMSVREEFKLD
jgi:uncharacterized tellurite resistance protein B-like protein